LRNKDRILLNKRVEKVSTADSGARAVDSAATRPMDSLSKEKEVNSMPLAGQGNNHSSPSLEKSPGK
jgi:hypothetical protein